MEKNTIKKNAFFNIIYNVVNIVFPLITFPYVSRVLMVSGLGKVTFFSSISNYAVMLASLGIATYGTRAISRVRDNEKDLSKTAYELLIINCLATIAVVALLLISSIFISKLFAEPVLLFINCMVVFATPFGMNWLFSGLEQYGYITKRTIAIKTISLLLVFMLVKKPDDYCIYAAILSFSTVGANIINFLYARKYVSFKYVEEREYGKHIKPMLVLFASSLAVSVYINLDTIMLGFITGNEQVGLYTVAVKVKSLLLVAINAISTVLLPRLSYYLANDRWNDFQRILEKSISTIVMISAPLVLFFMIEAKNCVLFLGGTEYLDAAMCMVIVMPILLISGFSNITGNQILIPMGKENCFMKAVISGAIVDLVLNFLLMPRWGCIGAAVATIAAECTQLGIQIYFSRNYVLPAIKWKTIWKIFVSVICAASTIIVFHNMLNYRSVINLFISAVVFFSVYGAMLLLQKEDVLLGYLKDMRTHFPL